MTMNIDTMMTQMAQLQRDLQTAQAHDNTRDQMHDQVRVVDMNRLQRDLIRMQAQMATLAYEQQQYAAAAKAGKSAKGKKTKKAPNGKKKKSDKKAKAPKGKSQQLVDITQQCMGVTRDGERCTKDAHYDDGLCGQHHAMVERGDHIGPKPKKESNPLCAGTTKKGDPCKRHAMDGENYCYNHIGDH